jgi:nicotinamidase-related amidase
MLIDSSSCTLLVVDVQEKLFNKIYDSKSIYKHLLNTVYIFSKLNLPIVYTEQYPKGLGSTIKNLKQKLDEIDSKKFEKTSFSCFPSNKSVDKLISTKQVLICGIETHICILQTALDLKKYGYDVLIINEGVGSRTLENKMLALNRLELNNIEILSFEMLVFELLRDSNHEHFRDFSILVK